MLTSRRAYEGGYSAMPRYARYKGISVRGTGVRRVLSFWPFFVGSCVMFCVESPQELKVCELLTRPEGGEFPPNTLSPYLVRGEIGRAHV